MDCFSQNKHMTIIMKYGKTFTDGAIIEGSLVKKAEQQQNGGVHHDDQLC